MISTCPYRKLGKARTCTAGVYTLQGRSVDIREINRRETRKSRQFKIARRIYAQMKWAVSGYTEIDRCVIYVIRYKQNKFNFSLSSWRFRGVPPSIHLENTHEQKNENSWNILQELFFNHNNLFINRNKTHLMYTRRTLRNIKLGWMYEESLTEFCW